MLFCFVFYYLKTFYHLEGVSHYAAIFAPALKVNGLVVIVDKCLGEDPLVVVEPLGPLRDSPFFTLFGCSASSLNCTSSFSLMATCYAKKPRTSQVKFRPPARVEKRFDR